MKSKKYERLMEVRALDYESFESDAMIIEGRAIVFNQETVLFRADGVEYKELIEPGALDFADLSKCFLKYNHSSHVMGMARVKNGTLKIEIRDDGAYISANLANTTAGRDLYELVKRGDIDRMSFAFTIKEETYDKEEHLWRVKMIDTVYDVAAVDQPAYENTALYARRREDMEVSAREVEALRLAKARLLVRTKNI